jgi:tetratricopeptide (TPR) repeat protein
MEEKKPWEEYAASNVEESKEKKPWEEYSDDASPKPPAPSTKGGESGAFVKLITPSTSTPTLPSGGSKSASWTETVNPLGAKAAPQPEKKAVVPAKDIELGSWATEANPLKPTVPSPSKAYKELSKKEKEEKKYQSFANEISNYGNNVPTALSYEVGSEALRLNKPLEAINFFSQTLANIKKADTGQRIIQGEAGDTKMTYDASKNPSYSLYGIGSAMFQMGDYEQALTYYNEAKAADPSNSIVDFGIARSKQKLGLEFKEDLARAQAAKDKELSGEELRAQGVSVGLADQIEEEAISNEEKRQAAQRGYDISEGLTAFVTGYDPTGGLGFLKYINPLPALTLGSLAEQAVADVNEQKEQNKFQREYSGLDYITGGVTKVASGLTSMALNTVSTGSRIMANAFGGDLSKSPLYGGFFNGLADKSDDVVDYVNEVAKKYPIPTNTFLGKLEHSVLGAVPLIATITLLKGRSKTTELQNMRDLSLVMGTEEGTRSFTDRYKETRDFGDALIEGGKGFVTGLESAAKLEVLMGVGKKVLAPVVEIPALKFINKINPKFSSAAQREAFATQAGNMIGVSTVFGGDQAMKDLLNKRDVGEDALVQTLTGAAFETLPFAGAAKDIVKAKLEGKRVNKDALKLIKQKNTENALSVFFRSDPEAIVAAHDNVETVDNLETKAAEIGMSISGKTDLEEIKGLLYAQVGLNNIANVKKLSQIASDYPEVLIEKINESNIKEEDKVVLRQKVEDLHKELNPYERKVTKISDEIEEIGKRMIDFEGTDILSPADQARAKIKISKLEAMRKAKEDEMNMVISDKEKGQNRPSDLRKNTDSTEENWGTINRNDGKGIVSLNRRQYEQELIKESTPLKTTSQEKRTEALSDEDILSIQKKQAELGQSQHPMDDAPSEILDTVEKMEAGESATEEERKTASNYLYNKYKELRALKKSPERMYTVDQIDVMLEQLGKDIELLESKAKFEEFEAEQANMQPKAEETIPVVEAPKTEADRAAEIERLRVEEQKELNAAIPNADKYKTDGKVDRDKLTNPEDIKAFDEIYDKYDKLITAPKVEGGFKPILSESIDIESNEGRKGLVPISELEEFIGEDRLGEAEMPTSRATIDRLKEDISKNGFKEPIVIVYDKFSNGGEATIIEGNHRIIAAKELGLTEIPVRFEKGTIRDNESRVKDKMFPIKRKAIGKLNDTKGVKGSDLGLTVRQPTEADFVKTTQEAPKAEAGSGVGGDVEATAKKLEDLSNKVTEKNDEPLKEWEEHKIGDTFEVNNVYKQLPESSATPSNGNYTLETIPVSATDLNYSFSNGKGKIEKGIPSLSREHWEWDNEDGYQTEQLNMIKKGFDTNQREPIIVERGSDGMYHVIDGHHRLTIAKELGRNNILALVREGTTEKTPKTFKGVSEAYHKAKLDNSNPELVKAVESLLSKEQTPKAENKKVDVAGSAVEGDVERIEIPRYFTFKELGGGKGKSGKVMSSVEADKNEEISENFKQQLQEGDKLIEPNGTVTYFKNGKVVKADGSMYGMVDIPAFITGVTIERSKKPLKPKTETTPTIEAPKVEAKEKEVIPTQDEGGQESTELRSEEESNKDKQELKRIDDDIAASEDKIEDFKSEIEIEKGNLKEEKARIKQEKAKVRASSMSKKEKVERLEELDAELEDAINEHEDLVQQYRDDMAQERSDIKDLKKEKAAIEKKAAEKKQKVEPVKEEKIIPAGKRLFNEPNPETAEISKQFKKENGIDTPEGENITEIDQDNSKKIADAYEEMKDSPDDPIVQKAYQELADQTADQHQALIDAGYEVELWEGEGEPYKNAQEMINDVRNNKHMYIFSTESGYGDSPITDKQRSQNKMLQDSGFKDKNGKRLLYNDIFRFVHDKFGHNERGNGFGAIGEENAWDVHYRMYKSPLARRALTTETRGQNSWVNFGKHMRNPDGSIKTAKDQGYVSPKDRPFAEQKMGLLPEWASENKYLEKDLENQKKSKSKAEEETTEKTEEAPKKTEREVIEEYVDMFDSMREEETTSSEKRSMAEKMNKMLDENPNLKRIFGNIKNINKSLEDQGLITKTKGCP